MKDITFIKATEGPFNYNRSLDYKSPDFKKDINIGIRTELLCKKNADVVIVSVFLKYEKTKDLIFLYNVNIFLEFKIDVLKPIITDKINILSEVNIDENGEYYINLKNGESYWRKRLLNIERKWKKLKNY